MTTGRGAALADVHTHALPRRYVERLRELAPGDDGLQKAANYIDRVVPEQLPAECGANLFGELTERLSAMDAAGIDVQVIGAGSLLAYPTETPHRVELVRAWNDAAHEQALTAPDRFRVFAALPLPDVPASIQEVERVLSRTTTAGFGLTTHVGGVPITDERWFPLFERLHDAAATVFVHPDGFCVRGLLDRELDIDVGTQFDDTLTAVRLYRDGVLERFADLTWIVAHLGGTLSFLLERLDEHWERDRARRALPQTPGRSLGGLRVDTAGHGPRAVAFAAAALGVDRLVFGSDFPMVNADSLARSAEHTRAALSTDEMARVQRASHDVLMQPASH
jgi:predicted TIM-barrel fold metal-dependent hydrolase